MSKDRVANRWGQCYNHRKERFDLEDLKEADHIVEEKYFTYFHHMIVESVDTNKKQINVIHYYDKNGPSGSGSTVCQTSFTYTPKKFYRIVYRDEECLPAFKVLEKARARLGKKGPTFSILFNNCEHFANECKTGKKECHQIGPPTEILAKSAISSTGSLRNVISRTESLESAISSIGSLESVISSFGSLLKHAKNPQFMLSEIKRLILSIWDRLKTEGLKELKKVWDRLKTIGFEELREEYRANFNPKFGILLSFLFEIILLARDWNDAYTKLKGEKITREEFLEVNAKRICALFSSNLGFLFGSFLSGIIPLAFGGWGALVGAIVLGVVGDYLGKVAGGYLGEVFTPLVLEIINYLLDN